MVSKPVGQHYRHPILPLYSESPELAGEIVYLAPQRFVGDGWPAGSANGRMGGIARFQQFD